ncbi:MAG: hypothetical protein JWO77_3684, partial [Ilumatobacteraceae bacterium]|nr:hypothetical protein [Ilumatobacteraceae bacterium]
VDRPRRPDETAAAYAAVLAQLYGDHRLAAAGRTIDEATYAPRTPDPARRAEVDALVAELAAGPVPELEPEPEPVGATSTG